MLTKEEIEKMHEGYKSPMYRRILLARRDLRDAMDDLDVSIRDYQQLQLFDPNDVPSAA